MKKIFLSVAVFIALCSNTVCAETANLSDQIITLDTENLIISVQNKPIIEQSKQEVITTRSRFC